MLRKLPEHTGEFQTVRGKQLPKAMSMDHEPLEHPTCAMRVGAMRCFSPRWPTCAGGRGPRGVSWNQRIAVIQGQCGGHCDIVEQVVADV